MNVVLNEVQMVPMWFRKLIVQTIIFRLKMNPEDYLEPIEAVKKATQPLFLLHGTEDELISKSHSEALYEVANQPKSLWIANGSKHSALFNNHPKEYEEKVLSFLNQYLEVK
jgi:fermentation-respiration switch protein FrsA (DUF1100 family)